MLRCCCAIPTLAAERDSVLRSTDLKDSLDEMIAQSITISARPAARSRHGCSTCHGAAVSHVSDGTPNKPMISGSLMNPCKGYRHDSEESRRSEVCSEERDLDYTPTTFQGENARGIGSSSHRDEKVFVGCGTVASPGIDRGRG